MMQFYACVFVGIVQNNLLSKALSPYAKYFHNGNADAVRVVTYVQTHMLDRIG